jgi:D-lyxose ketol-isomerase
MKRSEVNQVQRDAVSFFNKHGFHVPPWAYYRPGDWKRLRKSLKSRGGLDEIKNYKLGWDLTDFGSGDFFRFGLLLFTLRNGDPGGKGKPYAEKVMILREAQMTPIHFHWHKMEDIINRGGGNLIIELWQSTKAEKLSRKPVTVRVDAIPRKVRSGGKVRLRPGESVCLPQRLFHRFYVEQGTGSVLIGEVSMTNDDEKDNKFLEPVGRFPKIIEDEEILYPLCFEYP